MAGMFGLFNYNKPGRGISKDEPEKKAFFRFFELYFRKFWKLMVANLLYILVSLPIVTRGLAQAGLTVITRNYAREKHAFLTSDFFDAIKKNWKQSLIVGILELLVGGVLLYSLYFYAMSASGELSLKSILPIAVALFITMLFFFARYYLYIQIVTFKMSLKQVLKNSLLFAMAGVKQNLLLSAILLVVYALVALGLWFFPLIALAIVIIGYVLVFPAFRSFLIQFTIFPLVKSAIIDPYYKEHPGEDLEKRRDLNLSPTEEETTVEEVSEGEPIFTDVVHHKEPESTVFPKQYDERELRRGKRFTSRDTEDDDNTI